MQILPGRFDRRALIARSEHTPQVGQVDCPALRLGVNDNVGDVFDLIA